MLNQEQFNSQMLYAQTQRDLGIDNKEYWTGYMRGLRRGFHGDNFGTPQEHQTYWEAFNSADPDRKQLGTGYRDGIRFNKKRGRPESGSIRLDPIWIPPILAEQMESAANKSHKTMADYRRHCYKTISEVTLGIIERKH